MLWVSHRLYHLDLYLLLIRGFKQNRYCAKLTMFTFMNSNSQKLYNNAKNSTKNKINMCLVPIVIAKTLLKTYVHFLLIFPKINAHSTAMCFLVCFWGVFFFLLFPLFCFCLFVQHLTWMVEFVKLFVFDEHT